jgi:glucan 1,3-beta-glucosidase
MVIVGAIIGALVAKHIIHTGSKSTTSTSSDVGAPETAPGSAPGSSSTASPTGTTGKPGASSTPKPVLCSTSDAVSSSAKGTWLDPTSWLDAKDFNCTFTDQTIGDLPIIGLNSTWDDSKQANTNVPPLNQPWGNYSIKPFRGVSIGGWFSLEPFITPSLFDSASGLVDEYSICVSLGPKAAAATLEKHYSTFITEDDFKSIADAGLDHVRIPYSYWAVKVYDNDPYVFGVSWRYLLRAIEWARNYGLRVSLDLHAVPGSQNGWNHSGKQGIVDWLIGPNGTVNAQRTLDIHNQLSKFFAQPRYKNILAFYGQVNEPSTSITQDALITWTAQAYKIINDNGVTATQVFSESNRGLASWTGKLTGYGTTLAVDAHLYSIFDNNLIGFNHTDRVSFVCDALAGQVNAGITGFGPTYVGEWSQADTDCSQYLNGVGNGARWIGTLGGEGGAKCPTLNQECSCSMPNADISAFSSGYKQYLQTLSEAQMYTFEKSWGWFYWTWKTESAPLWSYQAGLQGGILPAVAYKRDWDCSMPVPSFGDLPEFY